MPLVRSQMTFLVLGFTIFGIGINRHRNDSSAWQEVVHFCWSVSVSDSYTDFILISMVSTTLLFYNSELIMYSDVLSG